VINEDQVDRHTWRTIDIYLCLWYMFNSCLGKLKTL